MSEARESPARLDATVVGRVQGVGYRYFVLREATSLGLDGWVANARDGSVRCVAEGERRALEELVEALGQGPRAARVERVAATWGPASGTFAGFTVRSGSHPGD